MSMNAIRQLNSGGLKLKNDFTAANIARNMSSNKGFAAGLIKSSNYTYGSNSIKTAANRYGGNARYAPTSMLSSRFNGTNLGFISGVPSPSTTLVKNFEMGTSPAYNAGVGVGSAINMLLQLGGIAKDIGLFGGKKDVQQNTGDTLLDKTNLSNTATTITSGNFTSALSGAKSFADVNKIENEITQKKATLNTDYKDVGTKATANVDEILSGEGVSDGMQLAGVNINKSAFNLSELNPKDLEGNAKKIDHDITKIGDFKTKDLVQAKAKISEKSGQISGTLTVKKGDLERSKAELSTLKSTNSDASKISELEVKIEKLEKEVKELEDQKKQIEAAEKAVDQISTEAQNTIDSLNAKKTEIEDMKKAEDGMKDKKYDLAKSQDEELGKTMQKLEKLNKEIDELMKSDKSPDKYDKKDEKRANKLSGLMEQRTGLYSQLGQLVSSLSSAGETKFTNSKNQSYTIKNLVKASNMIELQSQGINQGNSSDQKFTPEMVQQATQQAIDIYKK